MDYDTQHNTNLQQHSHNSITTKIENKNRKYLPNEHQKHVLFRNVIENLYTDNFDSKQTNK